MFGIRDQQVQNHCRPPDNQFSEILRGALQFKLSKSLAFPRWASIRNIDSQDQLYFFTFFLLAARNPSQSISLFDNAKYGDSIPKLWDSFFLSDGLTGHTAPHWWNADNVTILIKKEVAHLGEPWIVLLNE